MPKVSIIVPVYNSEPYLRECLDSILAQTFRDFELIPVDDGSTDRCGEILAGYAARDPRIRVIRKPNGGPSSARNAGLAAASGEYVYFPDSDDVLDPSLLRTVIPAMDRGYDMAVFGFSVFPSPDRKVLRQMAYPVREERELVLDTDETRFAFLTGAFRRRAIRWEVWNRVFRRDLIETWHIRFGEDRRVFAEDMYFTYFYLAHTSRILLLPDILYAYRRHEGSGSTGYRNHLMIYSSNRMTEAFLEHCRSCGDCRYLYGHFLPVYYLLHKGAVRRLRRYHWHRGMRTDEARELLGRSVLDEDVFFRRMREAYRMPEVRESYRKDRGPLLQLTDRLYTAEILGIPGPAPVRAGRKALLALMRAVFVDRAEGCAASGPPEQGKKEGKGDA